MNCPCAPGRVFPGPRTAGTSPGEPTMPFRPIAQGPMGIRTRFGPRSVPEDLPRPGGGRSHALPLPPPHLPSKPARAGASTATPQRLMCSGVEGPEELIATTPLGNHFHLSFISVSFTLFFSLLGLDGLNSRPLISKLQKWFRLFLVTSWPTS